MIFAPNNGESTGKRTIREAGAYVGPVGDIYIYIHTWKEHGN